MRIGLISDTHGLLRPEAVALLAGADMIIHAGDIGRAEVLTDLRQIAPVFAVRGNADVEAWTAKLPEALTVEAGSVKIHAVHRIEDLRIDAKREDIAAVVFGHSHKPSIAWREGVLFCNPGSAGPRRFKLPVTIARLDVIGGDLWPEIMPLL